MSALRGKKLDPTGAKRGISTGRSQNCGKQSDKYATPVKKGGKE